MARHSAIVFRNDLAGDAQPIRFDRDAWLDYVPLRMPSTVCVEDRLPSGAAAVLINDPHLLPIDARQKTLFDAIDGERTIGELTHEHVTSEAVRAFFEHLWWYDQIVIDASHR